MATSNEILAQFQAQNTGFATVTSFQGGQITPPGFPPPQGHGGGIGGPAYPATLSSPLSGFIPQALPGGQVQFPGMIAAGLGAAGLEPAGGTSGFGVYQHALGYREAALQNLQEGVTAFGAGLTGYAGVPLAATGIEMGALALGGALAGGVGLSRTIGRGISYAANPFAQAATGARWGGRAARLLGGPLGMAGRAMTGFGGAGLRGLGAAVTGLGYGVGGVLGAAPMMAAWAGVDWLAEASVSGVQHRQEVGGILGEISPEMGAVGLSATGIGGRGVSRSQRNEMARMLGEMGAEDIHLDFKDLTRVLEVGGANRLLTGTTNIQEFRRKFKELVGQVKEISVALATSADESLQFMSTMRRTGYTGGYAQMAQEVRTLSLLGGQTTGEVTQGFAMGSEVGRGMGLYGPGPGRIFAEQSSLFANLLRSPTTPEAVKVRQENLFGGPQDYANLRLSLAGRADQSGIGAMLRVAAQNADGTLNDELVQNVLAGNVSLRQLQETAQGVYRTRGTRRVIEGMEPTRQALTEGGYSANLPFAYAYMLGESMGIAPDKALSIISGYDQTLTRGMFEAFDEGVKVEGERRQMVPREQLRIQQDLARTERGVRATWGRWWGRRMEGAKEAWGEYVAENWDVAARGVAGVAADLTGENTWQGAAGDLGLREFVDVSELRLGPEPGWMGSVGYPTIAELIRKATENPLVGPAPAGLGGPVAVRGRGGQGWSTQQVQWYIQRSAARFRGDLDPKTRKWYQENEQAVRAEIYTEGADRNLAGAVWAVARLHPQTDLEAARAVVSHLLGDPSVQAATGLTVEDRGDPVPGGEGTLLTELGTRIRGRTSGRSPGAKISAFLERQAPELRGAALEALYAPERYTDELQGKLRAAWLGAGGGWETWEVFEEVVAGRGHPATQRSLKKYAQDVVNRDHLAFLESLRVGAAGLGEIAKDYSAVAKEVRGAQLQLTGGLLVESDAAFDRLRQAYGQLPEERRAAFAGRLSSLYLTEGMLSSQDRDAAYKQWVRAGATSGIRTAFAGGGVPSATPPTAEELGAKSDAQRSQELDWIMYQDLMALATRLDAGLGPPAASNPADPQGGRQVKIPSSSSLYTNPSAAAGP